MWKKYISAGSIFYLEFAVVELDETDPINPVATSTTQYRYWEGEYMGQGYKPLGIARVVEGSSVKYVFYSMRYNGHNDMQSTTI